MDTLARVCMQYSIVKIQMKINSHLLTVLEVHIYVHCYIERLQLMLTCCDGQLSSAGSQKANN